MWCFSSHFGSIKHRWQMIASVSNWKEEQQNDSGHRSNRLFLDSRHGVWSILWTSYTTWHTDGIHKCASQVTLSTFITGDKWWPQCQILTSNSKIILAIAATAFFWIQDMYYDQYGPALQFDLLMVYTQVLLKSLWLHWSEVTNDCHPCQIWTSNNKIVLGIAATTAFLWIEDKRYDQHRPAILFDTLKVLIHMVLNSPLWPHTSPVTNEGLTVKYEHPTGK
jgi:hypothetical protein